MGDPVTGWKWKDYRWYSRVPRGTRTNGGKNGRVKEARPKGSRRGR